MSLTYREIWGVVHGMILGAGFLLAFAGGFAGLYSLRPEWLTVAGLQERLGRLRAGTWVMAVIAWLTVVTGSYIVYPWYRAAPPAQVLDFSNYPRYFLLANANLALWHNFGMEWKEHVAWLSPILATAVAFVVLRYGSRVAEDARLRQGLLILFTLAFLSAATAGLFGAFITKAAPIH
jgi:hypothetical protein